MFAFGLLLCRPQDQPDFIASWKNNANQDIKVVQGSQVIDIGTLKQMVNERKLQCISSVVVHALCIDCEMRVLPFGRRPAHVGDRWC